jgi:hypothetical protein
VHLLFASMMLHFRQSGMILLTFQRWYDFTGILRVV